ncbi:GAF domain-containing protein [Kamptonema sp. UHCC 0994]|uniref:GAF domain-containing protein n=1 Tax=Kamptonema sp. UHCC 0994 TaxID=3031329 RepID=UPI0023B928A1|nr:GAF domain-containing protein [Kamptonema sp. UHCC 0994]
MKRPYFLRYGVAILAVAIVLTIVLLLKPLLDRTPTLPFFAIVMLSSWYGGFGPGLIAAVLSALTINYYFLDSINTLHFTGVADILLLSAFITVAAFISWLNAERQKAEKTLLASLEEVRNRTQQQEAIALLGQRALGGAELSVLMDETVTLIAKTLEVEYCKLLELLPDRRALLLRAGIGWHEGLVGSAIVGAELNSQAGYTLFSSEPVIVTDLRVETRFSGPSLLLEHGVISGMSVIIAGRNQPWGVLGAHTREQRTFTKDDINFFQAVANILAETIERQRVESERDRFLEQEQAARALAERSAERVHSLQMLTDAAIAPLAIDDLLAELLNRLSEILRVDTAAILLVEADDTLALKAAKGLEAEVDCFVRIPLGVGLAGRIAADCQPLSIERDAYTQAYSPLLRERRIQSLMGVPLLVEGRVLGVVHVGTVDVRRFTSEDLQLLQLAGDRVAMAIDRANLYEAEQKARQQAEAANRIKDEFLAIVSHELRTPLNAILGWANILRNRKIDEAKVSKALETIERNAKQQAKLIDDILDVSRIIRGKIRLQVQPLNLAPIIEEAVETHSAAAYAKNIEIEFLQVDSPIAVLGDPDRLHQIVGNLLSNAIKFTPVGGRVEVRLDEDWGWVDSDCYLAHPESSEFISGGVGGKQNRKLQYALIRVKDTGIGIDPEFLPRVFDGFRQADGSITRAHGGLGLGLTIARYLIELHGGTIEATSGGIGEGATFTIRLPIAEGVGDRPLGTLPAPSPATFPTAIRPLPTPLSGVRILVVDDDADTCELIATVLGQFGALVKTVSSAKLALEAIEQARPDLLVSDIGMPGENGYQLIRKVRQLEAERGGYIPAIALTAYAREEDRRQAMQAGFQLHFPKPVEPALLAAVLANLAGHN